MKAVVMVALAAALAGCVEPIQPILNSDSAPVYFAGSATADTRPLFPDIWKAVFVGSGDSPYQIRKVDEHLSTQTENIGFSGRMKYTVSAALTINGTVHILSGEADSAVLAGTERTTRAVVQRGLVSIARQAKAIVALQAPHP